MTDEYDVAKRATNGLTVAELQNLRKHISALISMGPGRPDRVVTSLNHDDWIIQGLAEYIRNAGMPPVKVETLIQSTQYPTFKLKCEGVAEYLTRVGDKNAQRALLRVGLKLMHRRMSELQIAISYLTFMTWIHRLPGTINKAFPGYMEAGLLPLIIRGDTNARPEQSKRRVQRKRNASVGK